MAMDNVPAFFPRQTNLALIRFVQAIAPCLAVCLFQFRLEIAPQDLARLRQYDGERMLLFPNHPSFHDPMVMFTLSRRLQQPFQFLAAHETFVKPTVTFAISPVLMPLERIAQKQWFLRLFRAFMQRLGMYSVRRGLPDRPSVAATLDLVSEPDCRLVIFAEGGCSFQNDTVMPYRSGGIQLAFQAMKRFAKRSAPIPDIYVLPVAIKYSYCRNMAPIIRKTLARLETQLDLPKNGKTDYERLRAIAQSVLTNLEQEYGFPSPATDPPWTERVTTLKQRAIEYCESPLGLTPTGSYLRERVYRIQHKLEELEEAGSPLPEQNAIRRAAQRLLNFDAIYDGYVATLPTAERFLDTLIRLEREVFDIDQPPSKGFRRARVMVAEPINLKDYFDAFERDRTATVEQIITIVQQAVQASLDACNQSDQALAGSKRHFYGVEE